MVNTINSFSDYWLLGNMQDCGKNTEINNLNIELSQLCFQEFGIEEENLSLLSFGMTNMSHCGNKNLKNTYIENNNLIHSNSTYSHDINKTNTKINVRNDQKRNNRYEGDNKRNPERGRNKTVGRNETNNSILGQCCEKSTDKYKKLQNHVDKNRNQENVRNGRMHTNWYLSKNKLCFFDEKK